MWIVNDSGGKNDIYLAETTGRDRGKVTLDVTENWDWEDLAAFRLDGKNFLLVADTGDNGAERETCTLYILREPILPAAGEMLAEKTPPAWRISFRYEGGPRDCESVAVDLAREKIILLSKRTVPPEIYELPLRASKNQGVLVAKKIGVIAPNALELPGGISLQYGSQPVALDISADASLAAVATYYTVYLFPRKPAETWATAFSHKPKVLAPHCLKQVESVAFSPDAGSISVVSEGEKSPIKRYQKAQKKH